MRTFALLALALFISAATAWADSTPTGIIWPGWRVETPESINSPKYPISWMFDGKPSTTWVYHNATVLNNDGKLVKEHPHGIGVKLKLRPVTPCTIDAVGIINGYAKSRASYLQNNRISELRINLTTVSGTEYHNWNKTFKLSETSNLQQLGVPTQQVAHIEIEVLAVNVGKDDDLCVSEFALFNKGKRIPWNITPYVLHNDYVECCGGTQYKVLDQNGRTIPQQWGKDELMGVALQPGSPSALLSTRSTAYFYDLKNNRVMASYRVQDPINRLGWIDQHTAAIAVADENKDINEPQAWFRMSPPNKTLQPVKPLQKNRQSPSPFLPGARQPNYGC